MQHNLQSAPLPKVVVPQCYTSLTLTADLNNQQAAPSTCTSTDTSTSTPAPPPRATTQSAGFVPYRSEQRHSSVSNLLEPYQGNCRFSQLGVTPFQKAHARQPRRQPKAPWHHPYGGKVCVLCALLIALRRDPASTASLSSSTACIHWQPVPLNMTCIHTCSIRRLCPWPSSRSLLGNSGIAELAIFP